MSFKDSLVSLFTDRILPAMRAGDSGVETDASNLLDQIVDDVPTRVQLKSLLKAGQTSPELGQQFVDQLSTNLPETTAQMVSEKLRIPQGPTQVSDLPATVEQHARREASTIAAMYQLRSQQPGIAPLDGLKMQMASKLLSTAAESGSTDELQSAFKTVVPPNASFGGGPWIQALEGVRTARDIGHPGQLLDTINSYQPLKKVLGLGVIGGLGYEMSRPSQAQAGSIGDVVRKVLSSSPRNFTEFRQGLEDLLGKDIGRQTIKGISHTLDLLYPDEKMISSDNLHEAAETYARDADTLTKSLDPMQTWISPKGDTFEVLAPGIDSTILGGEISKTSKGLLLTPDKGVGPALNPTAGRRMVKAIAEAFNSRGFDSQTEIQVQPHEKWADLSGQRSGEPLRFTIADGLKLGTAGALIGISQAEAGQQVDRNSAYETYIPPSEEPSFQEWRKRYVKSGETGVDYDFRGAYKAGATPAANGHWPDTFKKPNHPTFSNESQYAAIFPERAGHWEGDKFIPPTPVPEGDEEAFGPAPAPSSFDSPIPKLEQLQADPRFQQLSEENKIRAANDWWLQYGQHDPRLAGLPIDAIARVRAEAIGLPVPGTLERNIASAISATTEGLESPETLQRRQLVYPELGGSLGEMASKLAGYTIPFAAGKEVAFVPKASELLGALGAKAIPEIAGVGMTFGFQEMMKQKQDQQLMLRRLAQLDTQQGTQEQAFAQTAIPELTTDMGSMPGAFAKGTAKGIAYDLGFRAVAKAVTLVGRTAKTVYDIFRGKNALDDARRITAGLHPTDNTNLENTMKQAGDVLDAATQNIHDEMVNEPRLVITSPPEGTLRPMQVFLKDGTQIEPAQLALGARQAHIVPDAEEQAALMKMRMTEQDMVDYLGTSLLQAQEKGWVKGAGALKKGLPVTQQGPPQVSKVFTVTPKYFEDLPNITKPVGWKDVGEIRASQAQINRLFDTMNMGVKISDPSEVTPQVGNDVGKGYDIIRVGSKFVVRKK